MPSVRFNNALQQPGSALGKSLWNDAIQGKGLLKSISAGKLFGGFGT